jgi:hypothetical protein
LAKRRYIETQSAVDPEKRSDKRKERRRESKKFYIPRKERGSRKGGAELFL